MNVQRVPSVAARPRNPQTETMLHRFIAAGVDFATGVPCGVLQDIISGLDCEPQVQHVPANRESEAVGIAAGAYLAGRRPIVYMQNSGFFAASNDVASLLIPYEIPIFFVVSYRGCEGEDAVQHAVTGRAIEPLVRSLRLELVVYDGRDLDALLDSMFETMRRTSLPAVLLLKRGWHHGP